MTAAAPPGPLGDEPLVQLSPAESAAGHVIGEHDGEPPLPDVDEFLQPLQALEQAMIPCLRRAPCLVAFSGGRDSSVVLAVAASVARREGLPLPIPVTQVFPDFPETDEGVWPQMVIDHLRLPDWQRVAYGTELNILGPVAQAALRRHGLVANPGIHQLVPMLEAAGTGTVLTGLEGDGLFGGGTSAGPRDVLSGRVAPSPWNLLRVARAVSPQALRRRAYLMRGRAPPPWMTPAAAAELRAAEAAGEASEPLRWDRRVHWFARRRYVVLIRQGLDVVASGTGAQVRHPLMDRTFLASIASWGGALGCGGRTEVLRLLFGDLLPAAVLERTQKANFTREAWSGEAREFAREWDGSGLPPALVDLEAVRRTWLEPEPDARAWLLLQAAWMAHLSGGQIQQGVNCRFE